MAAGKAKPKMHPTITHLEAFFATVGFGLNVLNLIEM